MNIEIKYDSFYISIFFVSSRYLIINTRYGQVHSTQSKWMDGWMDGSDTVCDSPQRVALYQSCN